MTEISFYHLSNMPLEKALPKLLEKIILLNKRVIILAANADEVKLLNDTIWTYSTRSFLPHGSNLDDFPSEQPIYLTTDLENPNEASILIVTDGRIIEDFKPYEKILDMFNGIDEESVKSARVRWNNYKKQDHKITYWKQEESGNWSQN